MSATRAAAARLPVWTNFQTALALKATGVLYVFTTNRLYRKAYKSMKLVEEEIFGRGIRCFFVKSGIDTAVDDRWRLPLQINARRNDPSMGICPRRLRRRA